MNEVLDWCSTVTLFYFIPPKNKKAYYEFKNNYS